MLNNFGKVMVFLLGVEGGFVNNASDPGGMTNMGVTKASWEDYVGHPVTEQDMRALTPVEVTPFYLARFWNSLHCSDHPEGLDLCVFDFGVNAGPFKAMQTLQRIVGVAPDGVYGPLTSRMITKYVTQNGIVSIIQAYSDARSAYYVKLPNAATFGLGWLRRVKAAEAAALKLAGAVTV
jgi:hypothetical protein